jgi:hypothetical protein
MAYAVYAAAYPRTPQTHHDKVSRFAHTQHRRTRQLALTLAAPLACLAVSGAVAEAASPSGSLSEYRTTTIASVVGPTAGSNPYALAPAGDQNPYGLAVVPLSMGALSAGNLLVTDFNNAANMAGAGSTIVQVNPTTKATSVFASGAPISGPVGIALNPTNDGVWIGDFGSSDGSNSNVLLISPAGTTCC